MSAQEIKEQALKLSSQDREWLAHELMASVDEREITPKEGAKWNRRLEELESGKVRGVPFEEAIENARARLRKNAPTGTSSRSK